MNTQLLEQAREAYKGRDFDRAAALLAAVKEPGEAAGEVDHLRGNSLMKLGRFADAALAYEDALADAGYGKRGALLTNQGKALAAAGQLDRAVECFCGAVGDASYATPYKANVALGSALLKQGKVMEAASAYRQAAVDEANPDPEGALSSLGRCFMELGRPQDAVDVFRTAVDFAGDHDPRPLYANLGEACAAAGRMDEAMDAFSKALADGIYALTPKADAAYQRAREAMSGRKLMDPHTGAINDPLDPLGKSGAFMPDPSDTGFFKLTEEEMIQQDKQKMKVRRKHRHTGLKVFITLLVLLLIAAGGLIFAYTRGFGIPSQQDVLTGLFEADASGGDVSEYLPEGMSEESKSVIAETIPDGSTPTIAAMDASMTASEARVTVSLSSGGTLDYDVSFVRQGLGWAVSAIEPHFSSTGDGATLEGSAVGGDESSDAAADDAADASGDGADASDGSSSDGAETDGSDADSGSSSGSGSSGAGSSADSSAE